MARRTEPDDDDRDVPVRVLDDAPDDDDEPEGDEPDDAPEDDADDDEPDDAPRDRRTKAQLLAELERKERSLKRARRDARRNRTRPPAKATPPATRRDAEPDDDDRDDRRSERDRERREVKAERDALTARAEAALLRAGCDPDVADVLADRVRERDVDFDDDDRPDFTEWIEDMKENRPRAFTAARSRRRAADDDDEDDRPRRRRTASLDQGSASRARRTPESSLSFGQRAILAGRRADGMESDRRRRGR